MILLIDVGNSRLKWTLFCDGRLQETRCKEYRGRPLSLLFDEQWGDIAPPKRVVVANVVGQSFTLAMAAWVKEAWGLALDVIEVQPSAYGVRIGYAEPSRFGVDRWVSLVAARQLMEGPVCVVDCGTAITLDVMDADGAHLGGVIAPGLSLMRNSLTEKAQGIGPVPTSEHAPLLARDTATGVQAGCQWAAVGFIDRMVDEVGKTLPAMTTVITGGDAEVLLSRLAGEYRHEPDWLMKGLAIIAEGRS